MDRWNPDERISYIISSQETTLNFKKNPKTDYPVISLGYKRPPECCTNAVEGMSQCPGFLYSSADVEKQENGSPRRLNGHNLSHDQEPAWFETWDARER